jgi:hypothetical protein
MKRFLIFLFSLLVIIFIVQILIPNRVDEKLINNVYNYCKNNGYSTKYCFLVDFSKPSGLDRFYIYDLENKKIIHKSLCAQGLGVDNNIFKSKFSNEIGSNYSSLGKYKVGALRGMSNPFYGEGFNLYGLEASNSNAFTRGILIHKGNVGFETFPLPCLPVSKGCFGVSSSMMEHIKNIKNNSNKPILLYAYE